MDESVEKNQSDSDVVTSSSTSTQRECNGAEQVPPSLSLSEDTEVLEEVGTMEEEASHLEKQIAATEAKMREFESLTKYMDAERERKTLEQLKARRKALSQMHVENYRRLDSEQLHAFAQEKQQAFDERWEKLFTEHNLRTRSMYHALKERHQKELAKLRGELEKKIRVPKHSPHLLGLRQKQRALARCQRYVEAEAIRRGADVLEAKEAEEYKRTCQQQNRTQVGMMLSQQYVDMNALRQKTKIEREVMMEDRSKEQQQLDHRIRNSMMEMTRMHTKQALVAEGKLFDTGFFTQRGVARSSKPAATCTLLLTNTPSRTITDHSAEATASAAFAAGGEPSGAATSKANSSQAGGGGGLPPLNTTTRSSQYKRAGTRPKPHEKLPMKEDLYRRVNTSPRAHKKRGGAGSGKEQRAPPGRRRQEFSVRKLPRDRAKSTTGRT